MLRTETLALKIVPGAECDRELRSNIFDLQGRSSAFPLSSFSQPTVQCPDDGESRTTSGGCLPCQSNPKRSYEQEFNEWITSYFYCT